MKLLVIIYCCYGGTHSSPTAAAIHLGLLSYDLPSKADVLNVPYYDRVDSKERGRLMFIGKDQANNQVYVCGRGNEKIGIEQAIKSGIILEGGDVDQVIFVDTLPAVNVWMRIGGFLSRHLKWISVGRPLVIFGTRKAFPLLAQIVKETKLMYGIL